MESIEQNAAPDGGATVPRFGSSNGEAPRLLAGHSDGGPPLLTTSSESAGPGRLLTGPRPPAPPPVVGAEIPRWESLTHQEIYARVQAGAAGQGSVAAERMWDSARSSITEAEAAVHNGLREIGGFWAGPAAETMTSAMQPVGRWLLDSTAKTSDLVATLRRQAEQAAGLRNAMPEPPFGSVAPADLWTRPGGYTVSWSDVEQARTGAKAAAVDLMYSYTGNSSGNAQQLAGWAPPPSPTADDGGAGGMGAGGARLGGPPSPGGAGAGPVPSPGPSGEGTGGDGPTGDGTDAPDAPDAPDADDLGGSDPPPAPTSAATFSPTGPGHAPPIPPVPTAPAAPASAPNPHLVPGAFLPGPVPAASTTTRRPSGPAGSRDGVPATPARGAGRFGPGGEPGRSPRGATAEPRGAASERAGGGAGRSAGAAGADMMPPMGGGAGSGHGGDRTRRRPSYLIEDTDVFADDRWFPPPVIGAQQQRDDRG